MASTSAERLANLPGLHPQQRPDFCTRHAYHLFMLRIDGQEFGAPRAAVIEALRAEGIPCSAAMGSRSPSNPCFATVRSARTWRGIADRLDYQQVHCPNSDLLCREQALWLEQAMFLGPREDMDDIYRAFEKVHDERAALADWSRREGTR